MVAVCVLCAVTGWLVYGSNRSPAGVSADAASATESAAAGGRTAGATASVSASPSVSAVPIPTKSEIMALSDKYFGIAAVNVPWQHAVFQSIATKAGVAPNMVEYYVNWKQSFNPVPVRDAYAEGALPVLTWESFAGLDGSSYNTAHQSTYSLGAIIDGDHDAYITTFAKAVKALGLPIVLRFDHEMNGDWFPWSEGINGNTSGQYVRAWRHVWTLFQQAGAANVIWDWAPNIIQGASNSDLSAFYPGDAYVDWLGLSAYDDNETTAASLLAPNLDKIREFTQRPMLITETGAQPGSGKTAFTRSLLSWVTTRADVIGFVWNEVTKSQGSGSNWGFDTDSSTLTAFRNGIKSVPLAKIPPA